jgi:hypothetical protein
MPAPPSWLRQHAISIWHTAGTAGGSEPCRPASPRAPARSHQRGSSDRCHLGAGQPSWSHRFAPSFGFLLGRPGILACQSGQVDVTSAPNTGTQTQLGASNERPTGGTAIPLPPTGRIHRRRRQRWPFEELLPVVRLVPDFEARCGPLSVTEACHGSWVVARCPADSSWGESGARDPDVTAWVGGAPVAAGRPATSRPRRRAFFFNTSRARSCPTAGGARAEHGDPGGARFVVAGGS